MFRCETRIVQEDGVRSYPVQVLKALFVDNANRIRRVFWQRN